MKFKLKRWFSAVKKIDFDTSHLSRPSMRWLSLGVFGALFLGVVVVLGERLFAPKPLATILPANRTIAFVELHPTQDLLFSPQSPLAFLHTENVLKKWLGSAAKPENFSWMRAQIGAAVLASENGNSAETFLFAAVRNQSDATQFLSSIALPGEKLITEPFSDIEIISFPTSQPWKCTFEKSLLICAETKNALAAFVNHIPTTATLRTNADYLRIENNISKNPLVHWYLSPRAYTHINTSPELSAIAEIIAATGGKSTLIDKKLSFTSYTALRREKTENSLSFFRASDQQLTFPKTASKEGAIALFAGRNLEKHFTQTLTSLEELHPTARLIAEGVLQGAIENLFGPDISFIKELLPLLSKEWEIVISQGKDGTPEIAVLFEADSKTAAQLKKLIDAFEMRSARFAPKVETHVIETGKEVKEVVADSTSVQRKTAAEDGISFESIEIAGVPYGFATAIAGNRAAIGSSKEAVSAALRQKQSISETLSISSFLSEKTLQSNELGFLAIDSIAPYLMPIAKSNDLLSSLLGASLSAQWGTKWWDDAVRVEGEVQLK